MATSSQPPHHPDNESSPASHHGSSVLGKACAKTFTASDSNGSVSDNSWADLAAAEEGRHGCACKSPKIDIRGSPRLYWEAFQAMRQVGMAETRLMSEAEVQQLRSPRLS